MWIFLFVSCLVAGGCLGKSNEVPRISKRFSESYSAQGILNIPYAEIHEPFYAWFDGGNASSRIDYYGGMVKSYQLGKKGKYGSSIKIAPVTTEEVENAETCLEVQGSVVLPVEPQSVLPDISNFEFAGKDMVNGLPCDKWTLANSYGDKLNKYTMWTQSKYFVHLFTGHHQENHAGAQALNFSDAAGIQCVKSNGDPCPPRGIKSLGEDTLIPIRYEMKGFNTLLGSHYDHYYLDYTWFSTESPSPDVFAVGNYTCQGFPGPGADHVYTFNPMKEFVHNYDKHVTTAFEDFKKTHKKDYESEQEHDKRLNLFRQNVRFIHSHNRKVRSFQLGVNHLADRDDLELRALRGNKYVPGVVNQGLPFPYSLERWTETPESLDWRLNGAVTPVKDQSVCGSCWSFGTTGAVEGAYFLKNNKLLRLSQQALIDCSWGFGNNGCDGGEDFRSYDWIMKHGLPTEDGYGPYLGQDGYCHVNATKERVHIKGYVNVTSGDWRALRLAVAIHGPISVAIDASHKTFSFYSNGVYYEPKCGNTPEQLDHAVLVVGYGKLKGQDYWLVKNSWSNYWGNDGYVLMSVKDNNCGVTTDPTYVIMGEDKVRE